MSNYMQCLPFDSVKACPACGQDVAGYSVVYSTDVKVSVGSGRFVSIQTYGDSRCPHLEKHCPHCDFGWLEQTATAIAYSDLMAAVAQK